MSDPTSKQTFRVLFELWRLRKEINSPMVASESLNKYFDLVYRDDGDTFVNELAWME